MQEGIPEIIAKNKVKKWKPQEQKDFQTPRYRKEP